MTTSARYRWAALAVLVAGWSAAAWVYSRTPGNAGEDGSSYVVEGGTAYAVRLADSKGDERQIERLTGKTGVLGAEFSDWFAGLWQGRRLAATLAVLATATAVVCVFLSYFQIFSPAPADPTDVAAPPGSDR
jgi:hypothetical protein